MEIGHRQMAEIAKIGLLRFAIRAKQTTQGACWRATETREQLGVHVRGRSAELEPAQMPFVGGVISVALRTRAHVIEFSTIDFNFKGQPY